METIILTGINLHDFMNEIRKIVKEEVKSQSEKTINEKLLTATEAAEMLRISLVTLWQWAKDGRITKHKISGKVYFRYADIIASVDSKHKHNLRN